VGRKGEHYTVHIVRELHGVDPGVKVPFLDGEPDGSFQYVEPA